MTKREGPKMSRATLIVAEMRQGAILQAPISHSGVAWTLDNGATVPNKVATTIIARPDKVGYGDNLFDDGISQTYRAVLR